MGSRIELTDNAMSAMFKMAGGNPGALTAMMKILAEHESIDPQAFMGGLGAIMLLDTWGIYGSDIAVLFSDKCQCNVRTMLMLMRATQLGFFSNVKLQQMSADQMRKINLTDQEMADLDEKVCGQLEKFKKAA